MRTHIISTGGTIEGLDYENLNHKQTTTVAITDILWVTLILWGLSKKFV